MTSKKIYIVRHGETEYNKLGLVQGCGIDAGLNDLGRKQARAFHQHFKDFPFDKIYTSKLKRTHQSVWSFIEDGISWQQLEGLNEISWGVKEGRIITEEDDRQYYTMIEGWKKGQLHLKVEKGESPLEVQTRQQIAWKYIMSNPYEQNVLICMHGRAIRILLSWLIGHDLSQMDQFEHQNLCLYLLHYEKGNYSIEKRNDVTHLQHLNNLADTVSDSFISGN
ncbi:histidine phosphatase family protein [Rapidithrix thailandica]|uniref:Histidine phosphatase family protein n=1 Tax=Rapidithrix thailandica TaxID=413964 RepID=A0AAW9S2K1_9BACT